MKHMKKVFCLFMAIAMTVSMLVGCGSSGSGEGSNDGATVKLGLIGPMTGDYANYGTSTRDGAQVAVDEINEAGGVNGCKFVLQTEDSQGDPDSAVSAFGKLMDDGMNVSLGCVLSGEAQSVITAAKNDDLLIVTCTSMHSRNRRAGILLGQGKSVGQTLAETGGVVEGYYAAASMHQLAEKTGVEMPICRCVYEILYRQRPVQEVARELMGRARKGEIEDGWRYPVG